MSIFGSIETAILRLIATASTTDLHIQIAQFSNDPKQVYVFLCNLSYLTKDAPDNLNIAKFCKEFIAYHKHVQNACM